MGVYTEEAIKEKSRNFINNIDRSILGRFAVPEESLFWFDVRKRNEFECRSGQFDTEVSRITSSKLDKLAPSFKSMNELIVEWFFWWESNGTYDMKEWAAETTLSTDKFARLKFITMVSENPISYHDYFAAGILDINLIKRCIEDGIDAELAGAMG